MTTKNRQHGLSGLARTFISTIEQHKASFLLQLIPWVLVLLLIVALHDCVMDLDSEWNARNRQRNDYETMLQDLVDENEQLFRRLERYERSEVLHGISFILESRKETGVRTARKIAEAAVEQGAEFGIDYRLVLAVAWQESRFRPVAFSAKGAEGLMQVMPETQKGLARKLGMESWDILDIDTNIRFGTFLLSRLKTLYAGDLDLMLSAYNGGYTAARKYARYRAGELPADSLSKENLGYIHSVKSTYGRLSSYGQDND